jgi:hypothetical protein
MRSNEFILAVFALAFGSSSALGQANEKLAMQRAALKDITDAAERICNSIPLNGTSQSAELSGQAKAEVNGVIKKVADLGVQGAGKYQTSEFSNVLQRDLAQAIQTNTNCKQTVFNVLVDRMIPAQSSASPSVPPAAQPDASKSPAQQSLKQGLHDGAVIFIEIQVPKQRRLEDLSFLRSIGDSFNFTIRNYDPKSGNGEVGTTSYGSIGRVTASDTTLNFDSGNGWGCSGAFRRGDPGILLGRISCRDTSYQAYPSYVATINLGW